jgi:hypothetical protein
MPFIETNKGNNRRNHRRPTDNNAFFQEGVLGSTNMITPSPRIAFYFLLFLLLLLLLLLTLRKFVTADVREKHL